MQLNLEFSQEIPDNWTPLESIAVIKCLDAKGEPALCVRTTSGLSPWEALGMMDTGADMAKGVLRGMFEQESE